MKGKKLLNSIVNLLLIFTLVIVAMTVISYKVSGGQPNLFGYQFKVVLSGSMEPGIKTGAIIAVKPVQDVTELQVNDVITFHSSTDRQSFITHRIVDIEGEGSEQSFITKGDNNEAMDQSPIPASHVVAQYANITIPYMGYVVHFAKSNLGIILLLIIPGLIILITQMINVWRIIASVKEEPEENLSG